MLWQVQTKLWCHHFSLLSHWVCSVWSYTALWLILPGVFVNTRCDRARGNVVVITNFSCLWLMYNAARLFTVHTRCDVDVLQLVPVSSSIGAKPLSELMLAYCQFEIRPGDHFKFSPLVYKIMQLQHCCCWFISCNHRLFNSCSTIYVICYSCW